METTTSPDFLDKGIAIAIVLFILSLISERIITWIKLYFGKAGKRLWLFTTRDEDLTVKSDNPSVEKLREQKIIGLNIVVGIFTAILIHANLFKILGKDAYDAIGWETINFKYFLGLSIWNQLRIILTSVLGCILSGFFISLGSKFWHDMLDMLLYSKNLKEKLTQKETYNIERSKELEDWLSRSQGEIVRNVFEENKTILKNFKNVVSVGIGHDDSNNKHIEVVIKDTDTDLIPRSLPYRLSNEMLKVIPVKIITSSKIKTHSDLRIGDKIKNKTNSENFGVAGLAVKLKGDKKNTPLLLTCYHVAIGPNHSYDKFVSSNNDEDCILLKDGSQKEIGTIKTARRTNEIDAAIIEISDTFNFSNSIADNVFLKAEREIEYSERYKNIAVKICRSDKNQQGESAVGTIRSLYNHATIEYRLPDGATEDWDLYNLIAISNNGNAISSPGDSGAAIVDMENNVIGVVVAGDSSTTYAIPIKTIFNQLKIKLL